MPSVAKWRDRARYADHLDLTLRPLVSYRTLTSRGVAVID
jgi:hypothetical protein